jgi:hypothetical protein
MNQNKEFINFTISNMSEFLGDNKKEIGNKLKLLQEHLLAEELVEIIKTLYLENIELKK